MPRPRLQRLAADASVDLDFTEYARARMHQRMVPEEAVYQVVDDADRVIRRRDGRVEYFGILGRAVIIGGRRRRHRGR